MRYRITVHQLSGRSIPFPLGMLSRLTILTLLSAMLTGCLAVSWVENIAKGEPKEAGYFALATSGNAYEITRWWGVSQMTSQGQETFTVPSQDFPVGCDTVRFFLNDSGHELHIAQPASADWVTGDRPPLPDGNYPPCALLVSYGSFSEPTVLEGVAVTSATGPVATSERRQPHPAAWALLPVGIVADFYIFAGALVTLPVWAPIGLMMEKNKAKSEKETKEKVKASLPPLVAACWTAIDKVMDKSVPPKPDQPFVGFKWAPVVENAYALPAPNEVFSSDNPVPIDARVTLRQGRVQFPINNLGFLWTDADVECGLRAGDVVSTRVKLRK